MSDKIADSDRVMVRRYSIAPMWDVVRDIRHSVAEHLNKAMPHLASPLAVAASELFENAVKYGDGYVDFSLALTEDVVQVEVGNRATATADVESLRQHIDRIRKSEEPFELYTARLTQLMEGAGGSSTQLGLYRIACESRCTLDYEIKIDERQVRVRAYRGTAAPEE